MSHATSETVRRHLQIGLLVVLFLVGGIGAWAASMDISGAVIAPGFVVADSNVKKVQHPTGGIVSEFRARDGDRIRGGDVLIRLDGTLTGANLAIVSNNLDELYARRARLEAERDGVSSIKFPEQLRNKLDDPRIASLIEGETRLLENRRDARFGQKAQLKQRIEQVKKEIAGYRSQATAKKREIVLVERELKGTRELWEKNLMPVSKLTSTEREAARVEGEDGVLTATISQLEGKISETQLQIIQIDRDLGMDVEKDLRETSGKMGELVERKVAAEDQLRRLDIRAPQDGTVHQSTVHTLGGVLSPGETIMLIVPDTGKVQIEAKFSPQDIDQLRAGQQARLRFSAFNQQTTPEVRGTLTRVSPDIVPDPRSGQTFYLGRVDVAKEDVDLLGTVRIVPGMPVEVFIETGQRRVLSYLMKPLYDQITRAFRER